MKPKIKNSTEISRRQFTAFLVQWDWPDAQRRHFVKWAKEFLPDKLTFEKWCSYCKEYKRILTYVSKHVPKTRT